MGLWNWLNPDLSMVSHHQLEILERLRRLDNGFAPFEASSTEQSIPARFRQQVNREPDKLAVKTYGSCYTYLELERVSNRIGRAVLERSGGRKQPVALLLGHDAMLIASILGVLKAGSIYVPLDPSFPKERNAVILEDSQAEVILTDIGRLDSAVQLAKSGQQVIVVNELDQNDEEFACQAGPDDLAYIIFTSGSTGRPKGVVQTHRNTLQVVRRYTNSLFVGARDRLVLLSSCSVTASVANMFGALLNGASLLPFDIRAHGFSALAQWLRSEAVTVYHSVASVFRHLLRNLPPASSFPSIRLVRLGGDLVYKSDFELFKRFFHSHSIMVNGYGCSEMSSVWQYYLDVNTEIPGHVAPVGYPSADVKAYLLQAGGELLLVGGWDDPSPASGGVGEIVLQSAYITPGYWNRPELTHAAFGAAPDRSGQPTYMTGDLGYLLPDGSLVHAGRKDSQVKINGVRVEMAEVEAVLREHRSVREAAVIAHAITETEKQLLAFVVGSSKAEDLTPDLRLHLQANLPAHMIPAAIIRVGELPFTPNGKLDRAALLQLKEKADALFPEPLLPRTEAERAVAQIWRDLLNTDLISIDHDFFSIGGNSLLAIRVMTELRARFGIRLPLRVFFEAPTIRQLANKLSESERALESGDPASHIVREKSTDVPASLAQQALWLIDEMNPGNYAYHMHRSLLIRGPLDPELWKKALEAVGDRHEGLRTTFAVRQGVLTQVIKSKASCALIQVDLSALPEIRNRAESTRLVAEQARTPFDLSRGPLWRAMIIRRAEEEFLFSVTMSHIISDGWSFDLFFRDLSLFYQQEISGQRANLPALPMQYADYCEWQRKHLERNQVERQLAYWRRQLAGHSLESPLYADYARPALQTFAGARHAFAFSEAVSQGGRRLAQREQATLFMFLLAAFKALLLKYTAQEDLVVGCAVAGRTVPQTEESLGLFANLLLLRTDLSGNPSFLELLGRVRRVALDAYDHQDLPFEILAEDLRQRRGRKALVQIAFVLRNTPVKSVPLTGIALTPIEMDKGAAKYDLTLVIHESGTVLNGEFEYNTDLFEATTIRRLADSFKALLENIVKKPDARLSDLSTCNEPELRRLA
jgi:amino acid adenylation domain-containing protein